MSISLHDTMRSLMKSFTDAQCEFMKFAAAAGVDGTLQGFYQLPADL